MKRQLTEWEKIFSNHVSNKGLIFITYEELIQLNSNNNQSQLKTEQKNWIAIQMAIRYLKRWSLIIKKMQIKTTMRYHLTIIRLATIKKKRWQVLLRIWGKGTFGFCWLECKLVQPLWKIVWHFPQKIKYRSTIWTINLTSEYTSKGNENKILKRHLYSHVYWSIFTIAKIWRQSKSPSMDKWIKMMMCVYTMNYYSSKREKEILTLLRTWADFWGYYAKWNKSEKGQCVEPKMPHSAVQTRIVVTRGQIVGEKEKCWSEGIDFQLQDKYILRI